MAQKNYFAVVKKSTGKMVLINGQLPIYWRKDIAQFFAKPYPDFEVIPVSAMLLNKSLTISEG